MHAPALLAFALGEELVSFDAVVALAHTAPPWEAAQLSWGLASQLDDAELEALQAALRGRGVEGYAIQAELIARGRFSAALGEPPNVSFDLFEQAFPALAEAERALWIGLVVSKLNELLERPNATTQKRLQAAKVALRHLPEPARRSALESLTAAYEQEAAEGRYAELELDPTLELARTHASVGSGERALALLEERERRYASYVSNQEIDECARLLECLPADRRPHVYERCLRWARATEPSGEHENVAEVKWLTSTARTVERDVGPELLRVVKGSGMAEALAEMLRDKTLPLAVRDAAVERLVGLADAYVRTLREVTAGGSVKDWNRHATAVRQLCVSVWAVGRYAPELPELLAARLRAAARSWSTWLAAQDISFDSLPHVNTLIAWIPQCRPELAEAIEHVAKLARSKQSWFVGLEHWELVFAPEEAREIARAALAEP